ncbi:MAG: hypothetical protein DHS20C01_08680 [marine bacterium B5-7]|nr:MAG: hypothetical protein DHS20C01_08680 [marine bacterium B5-7]
MTSLKSAVPPLLQSRKNLTHRRALTLTVLALVILALQPLTASANKIGDFFRQFDPEEFHNDMSQRVLTTANKIDGLFGNDRIDDESQQTRIRTYVDTEWDSETGTDIGIKLRAHLVLPNTKDRLRIEFNGSDDDDTLDDPNEEDLTSDSEKERTVGLNVTANRGRRSQTDFGLGLRYRDSSLVVYEKARHRIYLSGDKWLPRLTNDLRHYGDTGFEYKAQLDFDRVFTDYWFFRPRTEIRWYENQETDEDDLKCNDGWCFNQFFSLYQRFDNPDFAIAYDWYNYFVTEPDTQLDELQLRVRFRQRVKWDWLHFEVRPRVRFLEEEDYDARYSVLFRVEGIFGYQPGAETQFKEVEHLIPEEDTNSSTN